VARPGDELAPGIEDLRQVLGHLVERPSQLRELGRSALGRPRAQIASREGRGGGAQPVDLGGDRPRQEQTGDDGRGRRGGRYGQDLHVVAHVEHDPAGEEDGAERQDDGEERQADELEPDGREQAQSECDAQPCDEGRDRHEEGELDHGANR
jgi:hypothetical protein